MVGTGLPRRRRCGFDPWVGKIPWRRKWQPIPVFLPGKSHEQRSLAGYSPWVRKRVRHELATKQPEIGQKRNIYTMGFGLYLCILLESWLKPAHHWAQSSRTQMQKLTLGFGFQLRYFSVVLFTLLFFSSLVCKNQGNNSTMTIMRLQWVNSHFTE